jgi:hypothetical protein
LELVLNLVWITISTSALLAWANWRMGSSSDSAPQMLRGLLVVGCILALLFPVVSISDDLSQTLTLAEGNRMQDVFKAPELRGIYFLSAILPSLLLRGQLESRNLTRSFAAQAPVVLHKICWSPVIEKRPPPSS